MRYLIVRCTGGAMSQLLAVSNAIYLRQQKGINFKIHHFVFGVGTKYSFALRNLLKDHEVLDLEHVHRGYSEHTSVKNGVVVENGPLQKVSLESMYSAIRGRRVDKIVKWKVRREFILNASIQSLNSVPLNTRILSGNYVPLDNAEVLNELRVRFLNFGENSPFLRPEVKCDVVIHYRIGDIRLKYDLPTTSGDGILDPKSFLRAVKSIPGWESLSIGVVSDSPAVASKMLEDVGLKTISLSYRNNLWIDLQQMIHCRYFIGSHSQVSAFASAVRKSRNLLSYSPNLDSSKKPSVWRIAGARGFDAEYLSRSHPIFSLKANYEGNPTYNIYEKDGSL